MIKKGISLLMALLIVLTALALTPLSAAAETADKNAETVDETAAETSVEAVDTAASYTDPAENSTEEPATVDYPVITDIQNLDEGIRITWDSYGDNTLYRVYYRKAVLSDSWEEKYDGQGWTRLAQVQGNTYIHSGPADGELGAYTVRCVDDKGNFTSDYNREGWENRYYAPPVITSVTYLNGSYTISWTGNSAVNAYCVFRRQLDDQNLAVIANAVTDNSFVDDSARRDTVYAYTVCAVNENGDPVSALAADSLYYNNGSAVNSAVPTADSAYRFSNGEPASGYFSENGTTYYYSDGKRVAQNWYKKNLYKADYNRTQWLYELMSCSGDKPLVSVDDSKAVFKLAKQRGIISSYSASDYQAPVDRLFVAHTLVKALGYKSRSVGTVSDSSDSDLSTIAYYGYFIPDDNNRLYPNAKVTPVEFDSLLSELRLYQALHGKTVITFGDSIVYGVGNPISSTAWEGMSELVGKKYGMNYKDYSKPGAVMGQSSGKSHIPDQVRKAISDNRYADLIILNGGTNDIWHSDITLGDTTDGYDMSSIGETSFTNGVEKTMWLITNQWSGVPVIYVRSHKMSLGSQANQQRYGEAALNLAEKWRIAGIDLYDNSGLDGTVRSMAERYTFDNDTKYRGIHPNALGYAKYYLPVISQNIAYTVSAAYLGDADGDGEVTSVDSTLIQRYNAGLPVTVSLSVLMQGDVDGSGELDITDATYIQRWLSQMPQPYAIGS